MKSRTRSSSAWCSENSIDQDSVRAARRSRVCSASDRDCREIRDAGAPGTDLGDRRLDLVPVAPHSDGVRKRLHHSGATVNQGGLVAEHVRAEPLRHQQRRRRLAGPAIARDAHALACGGADRGVWMKTPSSATPAHSSGRSYLMTKFTIFPGTTTTRTISLPSTSFATASRASPASVTSVWLAC